MASSKTPSPASLLRMPREIRDMVYANLMPDLYNDFSESIMMFPPTSIFDVTDAEFVDIQALRAIHPLFEVELSEEVSKHCRALQFVVSPRHWTVPSIQTFANLKAVHVTIEAYDKATINHDGRDCNECQDPKTQGTNRDHRIRIMENNSRNFVAWIKACGIQSIPTIKIDFQDGDEDNAERNPWITRVRACRNAPRPGRGLRLTTTKDMDVPLYEMMLRPFRDLPDVGEAIIERVGSPDENYLSESSKLLAKSQANMYALEYMEALQDVMVGWLEGSREKDLFVQLSDRVPEMTEYPAWAGTRLRNEKNLMLPANWPGIDLSGCQGTVDEIEASLL